MSQHLPQIQKKKLFFIYSTNGRNGVWIDLIRREEIDLRGSKVRGAKLCFSKENKVVDKNGTIL